MPWMKWLPWRFLIRRIAQAHGFLDPIAVLANDPPRHRRIEELEKSMSALIATGTRQQDRLLS